MHPLILKEFQNNWYAVGYSENHREVRTFGLDRIYDPKLLKRSFIEPKDNVRENYFKNIYGVYPLPGQKMQEIRFLVKGMFADYIHAHPIHESQKRRREFPRGQTFFSLNLIPSQELINCLLSFSEQLIVATPPWIQKEIRRRHENSLEYAKTFEH